MKFKYFIENQQQKSIILIKILFFSKNYRNELFNMFILFYIHFISICFFENYD